MTNVFVKNLCFYHAWFSIQSLFKTTPCLLKRQHENHTGILASDSSHEYTVDRRSSIRCVSVLDCLYRHRIKLEQRLLLTTNRPYLTLTTTLLPSLVSAFSNCWGYKKSVFKHLQLRFCLAWFLHLATAKVTESRYWPPHVFAQVFFRWHFECRYCSLSLRLENVDLRKVQKNTPCSEGRALYLLSIMSYPLWIEPGPLG